MNIPVIQSNNINEIKQLISRKQEAAIDVTDPVKSIIEDVRQNGDSALFDYTQTFDRVRLSSLKVSEQEIETALTFVDQAFYTILEEAAANIRAYHEQQKRTGYWINDKPGIILGQKITPLDRVAVYVPGGTASYPSTVLMGVIPAVIAGVANIVIVTPPDQTGQVDPHILAAAHVAGATEIYKIGGAHAIAALAYGTETIVAVDKITGPGNIYVATAKQLVYGTVDIDSIAGPSEVLIIADETATPAYVAADMIAQAEHDKLSASYLITTNEEIAHQTITELEKQLANLPRREIATAALENSYIMIIDTLETAAHLSNMIAPEHLELHIADPWALLSLVKHAGSIFIGPYSPEALGDYFAGPNHVLPTMGSARYASGLSVDDFVKKSSITYYNQAALSAVADQINLFAKKEGLEGHGRSVMIRKADV